MSTSYRPYDPDQSSLLPTSPSEWLPEDHLAFFISDTVSQLDLKGLHERYDGDGRRNRPFHPGMMLRVLIYAYATGTFSSRAISKKLHEDVAFRYLSAENFPSHRTISDFRHDNIETFKSLFSQVVKIAQELGLVKLGTLAIDGTKVKANASRYSAMSYGRMVEEEKKLSEEIAALTERAKTMDEAEDAALGKDVRGDEIPAEIARREGRLTQIQEAKKRIEDRQRDEDTKNGRSKDDDDEHRRKGRPYKRDAFVPEPKKQDNFTDPDSRIMKTSMGFDQAYNAQIAVESESRIIVANYVTQCAVDAPVLVAVLDAVKEVVGRDPSAILADAGYRSENNYSALEDRGIEGFIAQGRGERKGIKPKSEAPPVTIRMSERMHSDAGKLRYRLRKAIVEPVFGWVKACIGFRSFSMRGIGKAKGEWDLVCLAVNLKRMKGIKMTT